MQLVPGEAVHVALWRAAGSDPGHPEPSQHLAGEAAGGQGHRCDPSESGQGESQEEGKILNARGRGGLTQVPIVVRASEDRGGLSRQVGTRQQTRGATQQECGWPQKQGKNHREGAVNACG